MSYKRKNGNVISRRDFEKVADKETRKEFSPSGETPTHSFDGDKFTEITEADRVPEKVAPAQPAKDADEDDNHA